MTSALRVLTVVERQVSANDRVAFLATVSLRQQVAAQVRAHVWLFEHAEEPGRFMEFTEAADASALATVHEGHMPAPLWREVRGD